MTTKKTKTPQTSKKKSAASGDLPFGATATDLANHMVNHVLGTYGNKSGSCNDDKVADLAQMAGEVMSLSREFGAHLLPYDKMPVLTKALLKVLDAEDCRIFLRDGQTDEFICLRSDGTQVRGLRMQAFEGITGAACKAKKAERSDAAPSDKRFDEAIDQPEDIKVKSLLCVPLFSNEGDLIGGLQVVNKNWGAFSKDDEDVTAHAGLWIVNIALECSLLSTHVSSANINIVQANRRSTEQEQMETLLSHILTIAVDILHADSGAIFLHDKGTKELYSVALTGFGTKQIRFPERSGIAGTVFLSGETLFIPDAYADRRFNRNIDRHTNYQTRNTLCVPIITPAGDRVGVFQVLNKHTGSFDHSDQRWLNVLSMQAGVAMDNWVMFDEILAVKSYNENILRNLSNGILTTDTEQRISFVNPAIMSILKMRSEDIVGKRICEVFSGVNAWLEEAVKEVVQSLTEQPFPEAEFEITDDNWATVNLNIVPLMTARKAMLGCMLVFEDITREKTYRRTISRYVSDEVVDQMMTSDKQALVGEYREISTLFSDIRGFTSIGEKVGSEGTVSLLNEYFSFMEDVVSSRNGMIDKFIGDAMMVLFGALKNDKTHANDSVVAAVDMYQVLKMFNARRIKRKEDVIRIGIGISTGQVITGNIGSSRRMNFTAIGDPVNLSSRLESLTKHYGVDILICGKTFKEMTSPIKVRRIDRICVRGQTTPTDLYEVYQHKSDEDLGPNFEKKLAQYEIGLENYLSGDWEQAIKDFQKCAKLDENDLTSRMMVLRCRQLIASPPETWANVWTYN